jgi:hypothetical protein
MGTYWLANNPNGKLLAGSETKDFASIADGNEAAEDVAVVGARLGDFCIASLNVDNLDLQLTAAVSADDVVTVVLSNSIGGNGNVGSATLRVLVIPFGVGDDVEA